MIRLSTPISEETIRALHVGDEVLLSGRVILSRDIGHKYMVEKKPEWLKPILKDYLIYHCGPVVAKNPDGTWRFVASGPTTSSREEPYQAEVLETYGVRGVIGKGGMGAATLEACRKFGAVYFHAVGGCGTSIAQAVKEVVTVHKLEEFGTPEAFWVTRVEDFPVIVTMDAHGNSIHDTVKAASKQVYDELMKL